MLWIALSWLYIFFTTTNLGFLAAKCTKAQNANFVVNVILGLFATTVLASIWAVFGGINLAFHCFLLIANLFILMLGRRAILKLYTDFFLVLKSLVPGLKLYLIVVTLLLLAQCASAPYVVDNESYYIQTIKWLNEYGFVKGLANLHFFFGQMSGWHIAQSAFNFSFLYTDFNDLSGFCLLLGNLFALEKASAYFENAHKNYLIAGMLPLANVLFFQFISAPSPDIAVYVLTFVLLFYFVESFKQCTVENFSLILVLALFLFYIKNTGVVFLLLPLLLLMRHFESLSKKMMASIWVGLLVVGLWMVKNWIISGLPLFPFPYWSYPTAHTVPQEMVLFYPHYAYFLTPEQYQALSAWELFWHWLSLPKLNGWFNKAAFFLVLSAPFFILRFYNKKAMWAIYAVMVAQLVLLFATSAQYRFFLNFVLFFSFFCVSCIYWPRKVLLAFLYLSLIPVMLLQFLSFDLERFSNYRFMRYNSPFSLQNTVQPHKNSRYSQGYEKVTNGNLIYYSPLENDFFWGCGDGELPCVNKMQIAYFEQYYHFKPQLRTSSLKDGFYAKKNKAVEP